MHPDAVILGRRRAQASCATPRSGAELPSISRLASAAAVEDKTLQALGALEGGFAQAGAELWSVEPVSPDLVQRRVSQTGVSGERPRAEASSGVLDAGQHGARLDHVAGTDRQ